MLQTKTCSQCKSNFEIRDEDLKFYEKVSPTFNGKKYLISPPTLCPDCRRQLRLSFRNERTLYPRKCDKTGENILSIYSPISKHKVYSHEEWYRDDNDPLLYGTDVDFSKPFFEQLNALTLRVPRLSLNVLSSNENCDYVNQTGFSKNCYLAFNSDYSEQCYYTTTALHCKDCMDIFDATKCELCYMSVALGECYNASFSFQCKSCHDIMFCRDCIGCGDCFGCINLRNKNYCYFNEQLSREAYAEKLKQLDLGSHKNIQNIQKQINDFYIKHPHKFASITQCENSIGDYLVNSKNAYMCFDSFNNQDIAYCTVTSGAKDTYDFDVGGYDSELCYCMACSGIIYSCLFGINYWGNDRECIFCDIMIGCSNCFGCVGLRNKQYCILNKQYTKELYENIVARILEKMQADGVWGEFFPPSLSPYGYNESVANEYYPLNKEQALAKGFNWSDYVIPKPNASRVISAASLSDNIKEVPADIVSAAVECEVTGKLFRIIPQELKFLKEHNFPLPRRHPDQRHRDRLAIRNPRKLWNRACMKCQKNVVTTFAPDRKEIVYCDDCYLKEVY